MVSWVKVCTLRSLTEHARPPHTLDNLVLTGKSSHLPYLVNIAQIAAPTIMMTQYQNSVSMPHYP